MHILIASDAWFPQVNGVVRTLKTLTSELRNFGYDVTMMTPDLFRTVGCPSYEEIRLALCTPSGIKRRVSAIKPSAIHIATEGPVGLATRLYCHRHKLPFTTSYHTRFPEYIHARWRVPLGWSYGYLKWFHGPASATMVATQSIEDDLRARGFDGLRRWSRGVDTELFRPREKNFYAYPRPILLYVGRVAVEKNIEAFLRLDTAGTKVVVGDGPQLDSLQRKFPEAKFVGQKVGDELARHFAAADVFVFPSRTDTFGLVLLEALASGVPVAAYPVPGPLDVVDGSGAGVLDDDLGRAVEQALSLSPEVCRAHALQFSWQNSARQFVDNLDIMNGSRHQLERFYSSRP